MSHPPVLAVAIVGALAAATIAETYRAASQPKRGLTQTTMISSTPAVQLSRALHVLRGDIQSDSAAPAM